MDSVSAYLSGKTIIGKRPDLKESCPALDVCSVAEQSSRLKCAGSGIRNKSW